MKYAAYGSMLKPYFFNRELVDVVMIRNRLLIGLVIIGAIFWFGKSQNQTSSRVVEYSSQIPTLISLNQPFNFRQHKITPLERFSISARVLSVKTYSRDRAAQLSNIDLALGWGPMAENKVLDEINISQRGRWYYWRTSSLPIPKREIEIHSANMHMIASTDLLVEQLSSVKKDDLIKIEGYLISARGEDGWRWDSSLTREDTGNGACEVVWLTSVTPASYVSSN